MAVVAAGPRFLLALWGPTLQKPQQSPARLPLQRILFQSLVLKVGHKPWDQLPHSWRLRRTASEGQAGLERLQPAGLRDRVQ